MQSAGTMVWRVLSLRYSEVHKDSQWSQLWSHAAITSTTRSTLRPTTVMNQFWTSSNPKLKTATCTTSKSAPTWPTTWPPFNITSVKALMWLPSRPQPQKCSTLKATLFGTGPSSTWPSTRPPTFLSSWKTTSLTSIGLSAAPTISSLIRTRSSSGWRMSSALSKGMLSRLQNLM